MTGFSAQTEKIQNFLGDSFMTSSSLLKKKKLAGLPCTKLESQNRDHFFDLDGVTHSQRCIHENVFCRLPLIGSRLRR